MKNLIFLECTYHHVERGVDGITLSSLMFSHEENSCGATIVVTVRLKGCAPQLLGLQLFCSW